MYHVVHCKLRGIVILNLQRNTFCIVSLTCIIMFRGVSQPTISAKCNFSTEGQINVRIMGSRSIHPDAGVLHF